MTRTLPFRTSQTLTQVQLPVIDFEPLLSSVEAAALLRIHPKTLQRFARRGDIAGRHVGKCWRFRVSDLNDWLYRQTLGNYGSQVI